MGRHISCNTHSPPPARQRTGAGELRCYIINPVLRGRTGTARPALAARLEEACGLARAIGLRIAGAETALLHAARPATLLGPGKITALTRTLHDLNVDLLIVDGHLSPVQQRNLERALDRKVVDRTGLILNIFADHARTRESRIQVELAHLMYQNSRLVRSWTHLERQRGRLGTVGGPGETQIESDRRILRARIATLRKRLAAVRRTRTLQRRPRKRARMPVAALVGYTNAGKSTLFNRLTRAGAPAADLLFTTLDPTMRALHLPSGRKIILADTVGFISDLPTDLIAAFRATLEEVTEADVLLHVHDAAHPDPDSCQRSVDGVLASLGIGTPDAGPGSANPEIIHVHNKMDALAPDEYQRLQNRLVRSENGVALAISARTGAGIPALLAALEPPGG